LNRKLIPSQHDRLVVQFDVKLEKPQVCGDIAIQLFGNKNHDTVPYHTHDILEPEKF